LVCNPPRKNRTLIENDILRYHIHHLTRKALGSFVPRILNWSALGFNSGAPGQLLTPAKTPKRFR
jgi:hypothetical protein